MTCTCGSPLFRFLMLPVPGRFSIAECRACGLWRTFPRPTLEELAAVYAADYGPHQPGSPGYHGTGWRRIWVLPVVPASGHILELGSGNGRFVDYARGRAWSVTTVDGIGAAERYRPPAGAFDAVVAWHVLEHCLDPAAVLRMARVALRDGGQMILSTPNVRSLERWLFRARWPDWHLPEHLWHFSPRTMRGLLERAGFTVDRIAQQRTFTGLPRWAADLVGTGVAALGVSSRMTVVAHR